MIALNNTSIFIGQIKQVLHDFNLPLCRIGDKNLSNNSYYIKNNMIYFRDALGIDKALFEYTFNAPYLNITSNFTIENMLYDRSTHEYLGKYLRFLRDYQNINLMSMYNCFDGNLLDADIAFKLGDDTISFNMQNKEYTVYKLPISLVEEYSISLHSTKNIEICLFDDADKDLDLSILTYKKLQINNIFYYEINELIADRQISNNLYMLIKVPRDLNTSITVLEGRFYSSYNNLNILPIGDEINLKIAAQLLSTENTYGNNLLADRILEYLTGAVISKMSEPYDIKRLQVTLDKLYSINVPIEDQPTVPKISKRLYGIWNEKDREIIKYLAIKNGLIKYDSLGYVDKDIEKYLIAATAFDNIEFNLITSNNDSLISN